MLRSGQPASTLIHQFEPVPQLLKNVRYTAGQTPLELAPVQTAIAEAEAALAATGRLLIRKSGTEPLIRVMGESEDADLLLQAVDSVVEAVESVVAG